MGVFWGALWVHSHALWHDRMRSNGLGCGWSALGQEGAAMGVVCISLVLQEVCYKYWPTKGIEQYGEFDISLLEQCMHDGFLERTYSVTDSKVSHCHDDEGVDV